MAQADQTVQNATFPAVRADINNNLAALFSNSSGTSAPSVTVAHMDWIDTSGADPIWKKRNAANNGWITVGTIKTGAIELSAANVLPSQTGNSGKYLTTDGSAASWAPVPAGVDPQVFTSSGTWTKPSGISFVLVELWGAGGGGAISSGAGGGAGGAYRWGFIAANALAGTVSVTVGAGGAGRTGSNGSGVNGGSSSFGTVLFAGGGGGGDSGAAGGGGGGWLTSGSGSSVGTSYLEIALAEKPAVTDALLWLGASGGSQSENGGSSAYGGGGGGGRSSSTVRTGGTSTFGGSGGDGGGSLAGSNGGDRGGGGGAGNSGTSGGNGGRGEVRIYSW